MVDLRLNILGESELPFILEKLAVAYLICGTVDFFRNGNALNREKHLLDEGVGLPVSALGRVGVRHREEKVLDTSF